MTVESFLEVNGAPYVFFFLTLQELGVVDHVYLALAVSVEGALVFFLFLQCEGGESLLPLSILAL